MKLLTTLNYFKVNPTCTAKYLMTFGIPTIQYKQH